MTRKAHGHYACLVSYSVDGVTSPASGALFAPSEPTRRRSPDLSAYDRLDPPKALPYGRSRVEVHMEGMDRLRAALDEMAAKVNAAAADAVRVSAEDAKRRATYATGGKVTDGPWVIPEKGEEVFIGIDPAPNPDQTAIHTMYRWPDGSLRPFSHKRSETFW